VSFQLGLLKYMVDELLDQWYGPDDKFFKVCADDGNLYVLRHNLEADEWILQSFSSGHSVSNESRLQPTL
jgi:hypothetical protein